MIKLVGKDDLVARHYQVDLLQKAIHENTILFLPTGSGKTFVAIMLIKELSKSIEKSCKEGGKRTFFMVNTVALVEQQAENIKRHTPFTVGKYSGDMNVDYWLAERWMQELEDHQILVMTSQIFLDLLSHSYVQLSQVNLLIFDECHHGVNDHPMRQIMKRFETCPKEKQPRVLGMSATLIMGSCKVNKVRDEVKDLETTFHSKVATVDNMMVVSGFCTSPTETVVSYNGASIRNPLFQEIEIKLNDHKKFVTNMKWPDIVVVPTVPNTKRLWTKVKPHKLLCNLLDDLMIHISMLGNYGGSQACLAHLIQLERRRLHCSRSLEEMVHSTLITAVTHILQMLNIAMNGSEGGDRILNHSSHKVHVLLENLQKYYKKDNEDKKFCCVVFVQRRFTAKVLYHILKNLSKEDPANFGFIKPDFIVGLNANPLQDVREGLLNCRRNAEALFRFNNSTTNLLVSSDVLEEGIDIPLLSLVVKFDKPMNHTSYIQSKGRARHVQSHYIIMVSQDDLNDFINKYDTFMKVEQELLKQLVGNTDRRPKPSDDEINANCYDHLIPSYYVKEGGACVTAAIAIQLLNRYCNMLPQDKFTQLQPNWYGTARGTVAIQLPFNSPIKDLIEGAKLNNLKDCKKSAALEACKRLHQIGELDNNLFPIGHNVKLDILEDSNLLPAWRNERLEVKPGTNKMKRSYKKAFPEALTGCFPSENCTSYLHEITITPSYDLPTKNRRLVFYQLMRMHQTFAILSSKKMPEISEFTIYMNVGPMQVKVKTTTQISLTSRQIEELSSFNAMLFNQVLKLDRKFVINDVANLENAYIIVPTCNGGIDWPTVQDNKDIPDILKPSLKQQSAVLVDDTYLHAVIAPWYRGSLGDQHYIVTKVSKDLTAKSPFPTAERLTYDAYFKKKYATTIVNPHQHLVEAKAISNKYQCLKPRNTCETKMQSKRKRQELNEDFEEHLVPELCVRFTFPAVYWLKATCLPSILHRITHLLLAEELRLEIACAIGIGVKSLPVGMEWKALAADVSCQNKSTETDCVPSIMNAGPSQQFKNDHIWGKEREPVDIDRMPLEDVRMVEIQYFEKFINKPLPEVREEAKVQFTGQVKKIDMISKSIDIGPQQYEILQALTAMSANDIVNLERSETLGDSFLKFAVAQFLFLQFASMDEGKLSLIKDKILGNRNLCYSGMAKKLGGIMKVNDFSPTCDFIPPRMCVPRYLQKLIQEAELEPNILYQLNIPQMERLSGHIGAETLDLINEQLINSVESTPSKASKTESTMEVFIGQQTIADKVVADCVEAMIGTYLRSCGVRATLLLLQWFGLLPPYATPEYMLDTPAQSARLGQGDLYMHLQSVDKLEERLGYTFKDKSYLLQALTHPSYDANRITESYQRLEFLGDAILDVLITCHIYEQCGLLSPGELTDLRSALVNNICFAALAVRLGLHTFMLSSSPKLLELVDRFVRSQEEHHHVVDEHVLFLIEEDDTKVAQCIDAPKVLGDLLEAVAGAIYLDSGMSLEIVWDVFYKIMHKEIDKFSHNVPKNPVRCLYESLGQNPPIFHKSKILEDLKSVMVTLEVIVKGEKQFFHGLGDNKHLAKVAAAKIAMKTLGMTGPSL